MNNNSVILPPEDYSGGVSESEIITFAVKDQNNEMALGSEEKSPIIERQRDPTLNELNRRDHDDYDDDQFEEIGGVDFGDPPPSLSFFGYLADHDEDLGSAFSSPSLPSVTPEHCPNSAFSTGSSEYPQGGQQIDEASIVPLFEPVSRSGPITPDDVAPNLKPKPNRLFSESSSSVYSLPSSVGSEFNEDVKSPREVKTRRSRKEMKAMTPEQKKALQREQNKNCAKKCREKKQKNEAELENEKEELDMEHKKLLEANKILESEHCEKLVFVRKRVSKASEKERQRMEKNIKTIENELKKVAEKKDKLDQLPSFGQKKAKKSTNGSQKCRGNQKLRVAQLELEILGLKDSIEVQKSIRLEFLRFDTPPSIDPRQCHTTPQQDLARGHPMYQKTQQRNNSSTPQEISEVMNYGNLGNAHLLGNPQLYDPSTIIWSTVPHYPDNSDVMKSAQIIQNSQRIDQLDDPFGTLVDLDPSMFGVGIDNDGTEEDPLADEDFDTFRLDEFIKPDDAHIGGEIGKGHDMHNVAHQHLLPIVSDSPAMESVRDAYQGSAIDEIISRNFVANRENDLARTTPSYLTDSQLGWSSSIPAAHGVAAYHADLDFVLAPVGADCDRFNSEISLGDASKPTKPLTQAFEYGKRVKKADENSTFVRSQLEVGGHQAQWKMQTLGRMVSVMDIKDQDWSGDFLGGPGDGRYELGNGPGWLGDDQDWLAYGKDGPRNGGGELGDGQNWSIDGLGNDEDWLGDDKDGPIHGLGDNQDMAGDDRGGSIDSRYELGNNKDNRLGDGQYWLVDGLGDNQDMTGNDRGGPIDGQDVPGDCSGQLGCMTSATSTATTKHNCTSQGILLPHGGFLPSTTTTTTPAADFPAAYPKMGQTATASPSAPSGAVYQYPLQMKFTTSTTSRPPVDGALEWHGNPQNGKMAPRKRQRGSEASPHPKKLPRGGDTTLRHEEPLNVVPKGSIWDQI